MIKVLGLDIYGTVLATDDHDNEYPPRKGLLKLIKKCRENKINIVVVSDAYPKNVEIDLIESKINPEIFEKFYELKTSPKDFSSIIKDYKIKPQELLIIGDSYEKDIMGANKIGAKSIQVPEYKINQKGGDLLEFFINHCNTHQPNHTPL